MISPCRWQVWPIISESEQLEINTAYEKAFDSKRTFVQITWQFALPMSLIRCNGFDQVILIPLIGHR